MITELSVNEMIEHYLSASTTPLDKELGMDLDEVLRMKQVTGLVEFFKNDVFSMVWE